MRTDWTFNRWPLKLDEEVPEELYEDETCPVISTWWFRCCRNSAVCPSSMYVPLAPAAGDGSLLVVLALPRLVAPVSMNRLAVDDAGEDEFEVLGLAPGDAPRLAPPGRLLLG
jgi:hypothetical protein